MSSDTRYSQLFNQLLEVEGPYLTVPVARRAFASILEPIRQTVVDDLRIAIEERDSDPSALNSRWIRWVLTDVLAMESELLLEGPPIAHLSYLMAQGRTLRPSLIIDDPNVDGVVPRLLVREWPSEVNLEASTRAVGTVASPHSQMIELCQALKVPLGLVTNGDDWILVYAPVDGAVSSATWNAHLWLEERETLDFFAALLGARSFFGRDEENTIEALFEESADSGQEVTNTLGRQVQRAVELLVSALSEANRERHGELLADTTAENVYRAAVTVMMRLVFLLSAEERGLLLLGDETYDSNYAISTLWDELDATGVEDEQLFGRFDAWPRVLATFRLIHDGVQHERLSLPAYGGQLFDPERFPFLEGREYGERFEVNAGDDRLMKAINNKVMKEVLRSLQWLALDRFGEVRRVSYINLDVEQIGTVYEGLLDYTTVLVSDTTLGLLAKKSRKGNTEPEIAISELEEKAALGRTVLEKWLKDQHKFSATELKKLDYEMSDIEERRLLSACGNDPELADSVAPFFGVLRKDLRDLPEVFLKDSYVVTTSSERSSTGAHYTPRSIADEIVKYTLEPLVYEPGPQNEEDPSKWELRPWEEIVDLKIVDPACGSGAMLVAAARYLSERLVEAWTEQEVEAESGLPLPGADGAPLILPADTDLWAIEATRLIADRCLYGVDINEMAVEMCKLSLWLVTLAKGKPFSFLDHAIRRGDSLLGVTSLDEIEHLQLGEDYGDRSVGWSEALGDQVGRALEKRRDLLAMPTLSPGDVLEKERLFQESQAELASIVTVADALTGAYLSTADKTKADRDTRLAALAGEVAEALTPDGDLSELESRAKFWLNQGRPDLTKERKALHWPLVFPEVFLQGRYRFDGTVSNPPFLGGKKISGHLGSNYREWLIAGPAGGKKASSDLVAYFFLRMAGMAEVLGYLATNTIGQGDTSEVGLAQIIDSGSTIYRAQTAVSWPGEASVETAAVWIAQRWAGPIFLDGAALDAIDEMLYRRSPARWRKQRLIQNADQSFQGSITLGKGFNLSPDQAKDLIARNAKNAEVLCPYLGGEDLNHSPTLTAPRWVINFYDWTEVRARQYPEVWQIIEREVKPFRQERNKDGAFVRRKPLPQRYWQYADKRPKLYATIGAMDRVLATCQTSKLQLPVFVDADQVLSHKTVVFAYDDAFHFGVLTSSFHWRWAVRYGSSMRNDPVYAPSDVFVTFPQPEFSAAVESAGKQLDEHRSARMIAANEGLTDTYNRVHEATDKTADIIRLRELHIDLDYAVRDAYRWDDLDLEHGFHPVRGQGIRYTFSPDVAVEVLYRLLELNRKRYEAEVEQGLHGDKTKKQLAKPKPSQSASLF